LLFTVAKNKQGKRQSKKQRYNNIRIKRLLWTFVEVALSPEGKGCSSLSAIFITIRMVMKATFALRLQAL
jgi:hypothetical protein